MSKKLFTKVVSISLAAAMLVSMAPVDAVAATVKPKSMKLSKTSKIKVGQTKTITASRKNKKSNKDVKYVNFKPAKTKDIRISVKTSDDTVVSVEKVSETRYTYTGISAGTATLTVTSKAKTAADKKLKATLDVTVINPFKATQTGAFTFTMSTADKLDKVDKKDIKVMMEGSPVESAIKEAKLSEDKMSVEVTMVTSFVNGKKYEVTFMEKDKDSFEASVGEVAAINVKTQTVVVNDPTEVKFVLLDAKGMDVTDLHSDDIKNGKVSLEVTGKTAYFNASDKKVTMWKVADTADVKVVYHTWKYDNTGKEEGAIETKAVITCVDKSAVTVLGLDKWTVADRVLSWDTDTMSTSLPVNESGNRVFVRMKKSDMKYVDSQKDPSKFVFEAVNSSVLHVVSNGSVYGLKEGVEYVKVTYTDDSNTKYMYTLPVTITAARKAATLTFDKPYVSVLKDAAIAETVKVKLLDQYGKDFTKGATLSEFKFLSGKDVVSAYTPALGGLVENGITVKGNQEGTGVYKITVQKDAVKISGTITVASQTVASTVPSDYELVVSHAEFDATMKDTNSKADLDELAKGITFTLYETKGGLKQGVNTAILGAATTTIKVSNSVLVPSATGTTNTVLEKLADGTLVLRPVVKSTDEKSFVSLLKGGDYNMVVSFTVGDKSFTKAVSFKIKNDTAAAVKDTSYEVKKITAVNDMLVKDIAKAVVEKTDSGVTANTLEDSILEKNSIALGKTSAGLAVEVSGSTSNLDATKGDVVLKRAPLPSFRLTGTDITVWVVTDFLNQDITAKTAWKVDEVLTGGKATLKYTGNEAKEIALNATIKDAITSENTITINAATLTVTRKADNKTLLVTGGNNPQDVAANTDAPDTKVAFVIGEDDNHIETNFKVAVTKVPENGTFEFTITQE